MRDPFPIAPIPALSKAVQPLADYLSLPTLPLHIHEILIMAGLYEVINSVVSPMLSSRYFPTQYNGLSRRKRANWNVHVVSFVQSALISVLALWVIYVDEERKGMDAQERIHGYTGAAGMIQAFGAAYFLWDLYITSVYIDLFGVGMLAHAISALTVYSFGFRPFVNYYSCVFILWELSSPFLNIHWFCDKLDMTGSMLQLVNGLILLVTFFSCRLAWGTYQSYAVFNDIWYALHNKPFSTPAAVAGTLEKPVLPAQYASTMRFVDENSTVPIWLAVVYLTANLTLNSLNFYWFSKMIDALRKRFDGSDQPKSSEDAKQSGAADGKGQTTGVEAKAGLKTRPRRRTLLDGELDGDEPPPGI